MKIVCFGGGTGLSQILTGLKDAIKRQIKRLSAIVTVADSGGSTGVLRKIYDIPAIGDIRNCLLALSDIENFVKKAWQYRFKGKGLSKHPLGNLFLVALVQTQGNLEKAVKLSSKILKTKGEIIPSTIENVNLVAKFENGKVIKGEEEITNYGLKTKKKIKKIWLIPKNPKATKLAIKRIKEAELILIGPGSLYTSILPNFLIKEISQAVNKTKAKKIFIMNLLTQPGETDNFKASDHLKEFLKHSGVEKIDFVLLNNTKPSKYFQKKIKEENKEIVFNDLEEIRKLKIEPILKDLALTKDTYFKHSPLKIKKVILELKKIL